MAAAPPTSGVAMLWNRLREAHRRSGGEGSHDVAARPLHSYTFLSRQITWSPMMRATRTTTVTQSTSVGMV